MNFKAIGSVFFCMTLSLAVQAQVVFDWVQRTSLPTAGRWGAFTFDIDGYGYVAGGNAGGAYFNDVWRYDPNNDSWSQVASMPSGKSHGCTFTVNGKGYVVAGHVSGSYHSSGLWEYDPVDDQWSIKASLPGSPRYSPHGFALGGFGYTGGGNAGSASGPYLSDLFRYDPVTDQWTSVPGIPGQARYGSTAFAIGGKGYVHGGRNSSLIFTTELWEFDPSGSVWTQLVSMPGPGRSWMMVMPFDNDAVITGGAENGVATSDAYWYTPGLDSWSVIPDYPGASGWCGASFTLQGRPFGGLGRVYPQNTYHSDWWELVKMDATSIEERKISTVMLAPNPVFSGGDLRLELDEESSTNHHEVAIYDTSGRLVQKMNFQRVITIQDLASGSYQIHVLDEGLIKARGKLVVQ